MSTVRTANYCNINSTVSGAQGGMADFTELEVSHKIVTAGQHMRDGTTTGTVERLVSIRRERSVAWNSKV